MKALILAAGLGTRMRPLTDHTPKPLLKAGNNSLIGHIIHDLRQAGITDLVINHAWLGDRLESSLGDGTELGVSIRYSREGEPLETAGGIRQALPLLEPQDDQPFLVVNGDLWTDFPYEALIQRATGLSDHQGHLVLVPNPAHNQRGDFALEKDRVSTHGFPKYTFSGIGLYRPSLFSKVPSGVFPLAPVLREAMKEDRISGELYEGEWRDIGTPDRLAELDQWLKERNGEVLPQG